MLPPPVVHPPLAALASAPARILDFATEFRFTASRSVIPAGALILQVKNIGQDDHDLVLYGPHGARRATTGVVHPKGLGTIRIRLPRGRYTYRCSVADHASRGMRGVLVVAPRRRAR
jgi:hypothetical protein